MNLKSWLYWLYERAKNYNLFIPEVEDHPNEERQDPETILKYQKYTTRLYIVLLLVSLYFLFYITLIQGNSQTITISNLNEMTFNELQMDHSESLSCPCSNLTIPYKKFVVNRIKFDPICSSIFVDKKWIESLYLINASDYRIVDFRTTARAQFQLLSDFCSICKEKVVQKQFEFDNREFLTIDLLTEKDIQSEIHATIKVLKETITIELVSFLNYLRIYIRSNYFVSALNTNLMLSTYRNNDQYHIYQLQTQYTAKTHGYILKETLLCGTDYLISQVGFFPNLNVKNVFERATWDALTENIPIVEGFFVGCTPLESILSSTLHCLYDIQCIQLIHSYFPALQQLKLNWSQLILSGNRSNKTVYDRLANVFIEEWITEMNYSNYFSSCSSSSCSYQTKYPINWSYSITIFMSLYGGLTIILRFISLLLMKICCQIKRRSINLKFLKQINVFANPDQRSENQIKEQKRMTRVYFIFLFGSVLILLLFYSLTKMTVTKTLSKPSFQTYKTLPMFKSDTFRCSCSNRILSYESLISLSPTIHQICSSDFVSDHWLLLVSNIYDHTPEDWRNRANGQFNLLSRLCQLANNTINESIQQFLFQSLVVTNLLSEFELQTQLNSTLNEFFLSTIKSFVSLIDITHILTAIDQLFMGSISSEWTALIDRNLISNIYFNNRTNKQSLKMIFKLPGIRHVNLSSINCICARNSSCQNPIAIYQMDYAWNSRRRADIDYIVPGSIAGCSNFDTLLYSQLVCLYSNSNCSSILMKYLKDSYYYNVEDPTNWFDPTLLVYNSTSSRYPPNTSISILVKQLMIEQWNPSYSYEKFYSLCSPDLCTYTEKIHTNTIFDVFIFLISMLGGLTVSLRFVTPWIVIAVVKIFEMIFKKRQEQTQRIPLKIILKNSFVFIYENLRDLNIFSIRELGNHIHRTRIKHIGIWSTRLYLSLFLLGFVILTLYTLIQPQTITETFPNPSLDFYKELKSKYKEKLKCSCSLIASKYEQFVQINPIFHQICTSSIISNHWQIDISIFNQRDYRRFLSAHLQYLEKLCRHSIEIEEHSIKQFLNSLFITSDVLSENDFHLRMKSPIEQRKEITPKDFANLFSLIRNINHENAFISMYGTNFEYMSDWFHNPGSNTYLSNQAISYDQQCSCTLQANCTTQAYFYSENETKILLKGLKIGCTPSESLHVSTLECFYDRSCLNLIEQYTNLSMTKSLSIQLSQYQINTTVYQLIENLFVEQWITSSNYSSYFSQCLPSLCSHIYTQNFNILYFITLLLSLQGGLTIVLNWISPKLVRIIIKIYRKRKRHTNVINPLYPVSITFISNNRITIAPATTRTYFQCSNQSSIKLICICLFFLVIIIGLILFSVYFGQSTSNETLLKNSSTTMISINNPTASTITTTTTTSNTSKSICQLKFQLTMTYRSGSKSGLKSPVAADFNNDNQLDIVFFNYATNSCHVLIGDGKGNSTIELKTFIGSFTTWAFIMSTADFDKDKNLDLIFTSENRDYVYLIFGNGNGTFRSLTTIHMGKSIRTRGIGIFDFNNDTHLDLALASQSENTIFVLLGYGNGSFTEKTAYYAGRNTNPSSLALADINVDGYEDIIYNNIMTRTVGIRFGNGDGTFKAQIQYFVGGFYNPSFITIGDFNGDHCPDIAISYSEGNHIGILFGYGNESMRPVMKFPIIGRTYYARLAAGDLNNDGYSDIVVGSFKRYNIHILISSGDEKFHDQEIFPQEFAGSYTWMNVADFNKDGCQDILASDDLTGSVFILLNTCLCQTNNLTTSLHL